MGFFAARIAHMGSVGGSCVWAVAGCVGRRLVGARASARRSSRYHREGGWGGGGWGVLLNYEAARMLGGWVNPQREQQTIEQGQTSSPGLTRGRARCLGEPE